MKISSLSHKMILLAFIIMASGALAHGQTATQMAGGTGGNLFQDDLIPPDARILEVRIASGAFIDSVQLVYALADGRTATSRLHGGTGGQVNPFRLDADEFVIGISGRYGNNLDSLRIHTNKRTSPTYGGSGGRQDFRIDVPQGNQAVGFIGRSGRYVDAIGLIYGPVYLKAAGQTRTAGGSGGSSFTDTQIPFGARISEIRVNAGKYVDGIQAVYILPDGSTFEGAHHGGSGGNLQVFRLEANEYITGISGRHGEYVDSLKIHTNRRTSAQFGGTGGRQSFRIDVPSGNMAVALIGRAGSYMDAIGLSYASASSSASRGFFRRRAVRERN